MNAPPPVVSAAGIPAFTFTSTHVTTSGYPPREDLQHISTVPQFRHLSSEIRLSHPQGLTRPMATAVSFLPGASPFSSQLMATPRSEAQQSSPQTNANKVVTVVLPEQATLSPFAPLKREATFTSPPVALGSKLVHIDVGKEPVKRYTAHKDPVVAGSEFVRMALDKDWKEAGERVIPLPDDLQCLKHTKGGCIGNAYSCYILGEKILDPAFKDAVIDTIIDLLRKTRVFNTGLADMVYNNTPPRSHLRMLWRDIYTCVGNPTWIDVKEPEEALHVDFMMDMATKSMTFWRANFRDEPVSREAAFFPGEDTCAYHEHVRGTCYAKLPY
ncbi:hypothetical protein EJ03DRAFT_376898 [Teratosphaeria nubilosa]|uniref:Uncharacterized protein n=1 Tax=Teratosphaeria nubilosa TaxID=161662 RepID=A0A6G1L0V8_9PEZI|nr:hypothetical protein EJ03DRAFT_376898 [Teratosphaeria nubilosa]